MNLNTKEELNRFFKYNYQKAVQKSVRIVNDIPLAEDIVQECLVKIWEQRKGLGDKPIEGYFYTMVRNKSIDYIRKKKLSIVPIEDQEISSPTSDNMEFEELQLKIQNLVNSLPERCRQIFVLSRFENMSHAEISEQLDISKKTIENQITKALKVLTKGLGKIIFIFFQFT